MPMIWNHILFSEEVIDHTEQIINFKLDENYLILGAQGNNLLVFVPFWSTQNTTYKLNKDISEENFTKLIKTISYKDKKVISYIIGYITYYFLEKTIENYIEYFINKTQTNETIIKTTIDTLIMKKFHNLNTEKTPVLKEFKFGVLLDKNIETALKIINPPLADNLRNAYFHTLISLKWLFDPYGWKAKMFPSYTPLFDNKSCFTSGIDLLNEGKIIWDEINQDSRTFTELYNQAKIEAIDFLSHLITYWEKNDELSLKTTIHLFNNLNKKAN